MPENYEAAYTHPSGATAIFTRHDGSLDAVAKGLDSEQFWVFKTVKTLLVRNDDGDLDEATRMMAGIGFTANVRELQLAPVRAPVAEGTGGVAVAIAAAAHGVDVHTNAQGEHLHAPAPSYWPLFTGFGAAVGLCGFIVVNTIPYIAIFGLILTFIGMIGWGVEPFEA